MNWQLDSCDAHDSRRFERYREWGYDAARRLLRLEYRSSRIYDYFNVPPEIYSELMKAESAGEFVNLEIKPHYDCSEVE